MSHRILADMLNAFSVQGAGTVSLSATSSGVQIPDERFIMIVQPVWGNVNNVLVLPPPVPGRIVIIAGAATGGRIRSSNATSIGINGGTGVNASSAIAANMMAVLICESATNWKGLTIASNGAVAGVPVAAP
jgi:hypothetical protein